MSVRVMSAVWAISLPDSEKLVLLALADCANDEGGCWPSMRTLADKCSKSDRTVQASIKALVEKGHLTRNEVPGKGCKYRVHPRSDVTPEAASPPKRTTLTPEAASDKPSRTINTSEAKASSVARIPFPPPEGVSAEQWSAFLSLRKAKRQPMTPRGYSLLCGKLRTIAEHGFPPGDMIDLAIERGWTTVHEPKEYQNGRSSPLGRHQPANDGLSATTRAAADVFGTSLEHRVPG